MATLAERLGVLERMVRRQLPSRGAQAQPLLTREQQDALDWLVEERRMAKR